ncbi:MAG: sensor histidine kinase N-terminal domain-containing protein [Burkholderiaceae bacterium]|nr:sensor histidine kinase N-terminal domain-containing protein [Burkholderiaceae bacterium]
MMPRFFRPSAPTWVRRLIDRLRARDHTVGAWRGRADRPLHYSLRRRLIVTTLLSSLVCGLACVAMVMVIAWNETSDTFDSALEEGARLTLSLGAAMARDDALERDEDRVRVDRADKRVSLYYQLVGDDGDVLRRARGAPDEPFVENDPDDDEFYNVWADGRLWRVYVLKHDDLDLEVQIGQHWDDRNELLSETIEALAWPALALWLALGFINGWVIRKSLQPLESAARAIAQKSPDDLTAVSVDGQSTEVAAMLAALNTVLIRLSGALKSERRFTADAAHELRTPLAALGSKIQLMQRRYRVAGSNDPQVDMNTDLQNDLQGLRTDLARNTALVENLLLLARLDPQGADDLPKERVDVYTLLREVVAACAPAAQARAIRIDVTEAKGSGLDAASINLCANRQLLFSALRNLVDNAVRYGVEGGRVVIELDTKCTAIGSDAVLYAGAPSHARIESDVQTRTSPQARPRTSTCFSVRDDGPGVPPAEHGRLTQRFYRRLGHRATGNGLGLSIVEQIVVLHGGSLSFGEGIDERGLGVHLHLPND